ncbi:MAG: hypothetical protein PHX18_02570 [Candidatus Gastranaerophilales bacterium]|nr:hypothetical protein [Candidatus Gastranaerophilales bacterium]
MKVTNTGNQYNKNINFGWMIKNHRENLPELIYKDAALLSKES